jgi:hypothetical protein
MDNVVTKNAKPAEPMVSGGAPYEDLGGPTPTNSKPDDDSNKLKIPELASVKDVVNSKAKPAEPMPVMAGKELEGEEISEDEAPATDEVVAEEETTTDEVVAEEETTEEEVVAEEEDYKVDVEQDVQALFEGEELSEEFQSKARTIFEAAIKEKVSEIKENLQTAYEQALVEEVASVRDELTERVDAYLEYVADEWIQENQLQVESGLKTEMTESFLEGMKSLFEEHYVSVPEDKYDVLESMVDKLDEMESKLNEQIERNVALNQRLAESNSDVILADVSEGLALSQKEKLASLASNVEFESETDYREKLEKLKESYFPSKTSAPSAHSETISEGTAVDSPQQVSSAMEAYMQTLGRVAKK